MVLLALRRQHLLLLTLGLFFAFLVGSLIAQGGLPQLNPVPELFRSRPQPSGDSPPPFSLPPVTLQIAIAVIIVGGFAALLFAVLTRQKWLREDLISSLIAFLLFLAVLWLLAGLAGELRQTGGEAQPPAEDEPPAGSPLGGSSEPSGGLLVLLLWLVMFGALVYVLFNQRMKALGPRPPARAAAAAEAREEAHLAIERTLEELAAAADPRAAIFRCYLELREILARYGLREARAATAREFELAVEALLELPSGELWGLVGLFEEARYSPHPMGPAEAARARAHLEAVRESLARTSPDPGRVAREAERRAEVRRWLASR